MYDFSMNGGGYQGRLMTKRCSVYLLHSDITRLYYCCYLSADNFLVVSLQDLEGT